MNNDAVINHLAKLTGATRKQVIDALTRLNNIPEVRNYLDRMKKP